MKRTRARLAREMVTAMRVVGIEKGKGDKGYGNSNKSGRGGMATATKRATTMAIRVAGKQWQHNKEGNCDGDEGGGQQRWQW